MQICKLCLLTLFVLTPLIYAKETSVNRQLNSNSTLTELISPVEVESWKDMFGSGIFYGRLRFNSFLFDWEQEIDGIRKDHYTTGAGGSMIYKSAFLHGFGMTAGLYTTQNPWHMSDEDVTYYKVGKGVLSRYKVATRGEYGLTSLAQAYIEYKRGTTSIRLGRQIFESRMIKSNDIKMIPNTFEGMTLHSRLYQKYRLKAAYLSKQKLRDHSRFHHVFAYDDGPGMYDRWRQNDDAAMHRGITLGKLEAAGIEDRILLIELDNGLKEQVEWLVNYTAVPELFSSSTLEAGYRWKYDEYTMSSAFRYMHQFDHGAGKMGGANLKTITTGYKDSNSVEANLYGARFDIAKENWKIRIGMAHVSDGGDIISPWRAFPTGGFGYGLLQYNWYANTKSYLLEGRYNFGAYNLQMLVRYVIQDFDDKKPGVQADSNVFHIDLNKQFEYLPELYAKIRLVNVIGDRNTIALGGYKKLDPSYKEIRFELNYLF